MNFDLSV